MVIHIILKIFVLPYNIWVTLTALQTPAMIEKDGGTYEKGDALTLTADKHYHLHVQNKKN